MRQQAAEPRLTLLQGRARARGQRSRGKEVRQNPVRERGTVQAVISLRATDGIIIIIIIGIYGMK